MNLPLFNPDEVRNAIKASKHLNSCGPDGISIIISGSFLIIISGSSLSWCVVNFE